MWKRFQRTFLTFENTTQIDPKNVSISVGVHFGTCVLPSDNLVSSLNKSIVWTITPIKVIRDTFNLWNHSKHANLLKPIRIKTNTKLYKIVF